MALAFISSEVRTFTVPLTVILNIIALICAVTSAVYSFLIVRKVKQVREENARLRALLAAGAKELEEAAEIIAAERHNVVIHIPGSTLN